MSANYLFHAVTVCSFFFIFFLVMQLQFRIFQNYLVMQLQFFFAGINSA